MAKKVQRTTPVGTPTNLFCPDQKTLTKQGGKNFEKIFGKQDIFRNLACNEPDIDGGGQ